MKINICFIGEKGKGITVIPEHVLIGTIKGIVGFFPKYQLSNIKEEKVDLINGLKISGNLALLEFEKEDIRRNRALASLMPTTSVLVMGKMLDCSSVSLFGYGLSAFACSTGPDNSTSEAEFYGILNPMENIEIKMNDGRLFIIKNEGGEIIPVQD